VLRQNYLLKQKLSVKKYNMRKNTKLYNEKSSKELEIESTGIREEIAKMKLSFKSNPPKDTNILTKKRKQLAVLLTVLSGKKQV